MVKTKNTVSTHNLKQSKTMQHFSEVIKIIEAGLERDKTKARAYANLLTNKVNERQSQMIIDRITGEYKKKKVVKF
jgi:tRNA isopentenyl-2-thiomethyl-A-37 hydroxylase MiaE